MSTDALEQMRQTAREKAAAGPKRRKKAWEPPERSRFRHGLVLGIDQTLTHTGYALVTSDGNGDLAVAAGGCFDIKTERKGFEETYDKAEQLERHLAGLMTMAGGFAHEIVHEMPAVQGYRIESSLMAGREVRRAASHFARGIPVIAVSNMAMQALLLPPGKRYEKRHVKEAVEELVPRDRRSTTRWNEHVHDAVALALTHLYQKDTA